MPPQNKHNRLLWNEAENVRRRHPERSWCLIDPDTELRNIRNYFIADFKDVGYVCMINNINTMHKTLQRHALSPAKSLCGKWFINTFLTCVVLTVFFWQSSEVCLVVSIFYINCKFEIHGVYIQGISIKFSNM